MPFRLGSFSGQGIYLLKKYIKNKKIIYFAKKEKWRKEGKLDFFEKFIEETVNLWKLGVYYSKLVTNVLNVGNLGLFAKFYGRRENLKSLRAYL